MEKTLRPINTPAFMYALIISGITLKIGGAIATSFTVTIFSGTEFLGILLSLVNIAIGVTWLWFFLKLYEKRSLRFPLKK